LNKSILSCAECGYPISVSSTNEKPVCSFCGTVNEVAEGEITPHVPAWLMFTAGGIIIGLVVRNQIDKGQMRLY
jgi:hypothetical protein